MRDRQGQRNKRQVPQTPRRDSNHVPTNISNPYGYQTNGKKKHRDVTPI